MSIHAALFRKDSIITVYNDVVSGGCFCLASNWMRIWLVENFIRCVRLSYFQ